MQLSLYLSLAVSRKAPVSRRLMLETLPAVLTLHLKRFVHTAAGAAKLSHHIAFDDTLALPDGTHCSRRSQRC